MQRGALIANETAPKAVGNTMNCTEDVFSAGANNDRQPPACTGNPFCTTP